MIIPRCLLLFSSLCESNIFFRDRLIFFLSNLSLLFHLVSVFHFYFVHPWLYKLYFWSAFLFFASMLLRRNCVSRVRLLQKVQINYLAFLVTPGGGPAKQGEFPHHVEIGKIEDSLPAPFCGGTLISVKLVFCTPRRARMQRVSFHIFRTVLTAAHCMHDVGGEKDKTI